MRISDWSSDVCSSDLDVTVAEWSLMRVLYDADALAPTALADKMGMTKGAISKLAERLLDKSLVARSDNPNDKRAHTLSLTASGREKTQVLAAIADSNDANFFGVLKDGEWARFRSLLRMCTIGVASVRERVCTYE